MTVTGALHNSFSDMPFISPERYSNMKIDAARALTTTNAYILAFFDRYLRGRRQPLLDSNASIFPEVTLQVYRARKYPATAQAELSTRAYPSQSRMSEWFRTQSFN